MIVTTILVPGFGDDQKSLTWLAGDLTQRGHHVISLSPQPSNGSVGIETLAEILADEIVHLVPAGQSLNLVGFSMGGLICRYYVQQMSGSHGVERLVTIATPHQGTWSAYSMHCAACLQMRPGSEFLRQLNRDLTPLTSVQFSSIWTPFDLTILPATSSWLPVGEIVTIISPFHRTMLFDRRVFAAVNERLRHPTATPCQSASEPYLYQHL